MYGVNNINTYMGSFCPVERILLHGVSLVSPAAETRRSLRTEQAYLPVLQDGRT